MPTPSPLKLAVLGRCPACGKGALFTHFLSFVTCAECGFNPRAYEIGDGPAFFGLTLVGFIVTVTAVWVELAYEPPYWLHAALWLPLTALLSVLSLRFFKALFVTAEYRRGR